VSFPQNWENVSKTANCELKPVVQNSPEFKMISDRMFETMKNARIEKIERVQNKWLWQRYAHERKTIADKNNGRAMEVQLFHGTRSTEPVQIYNGEVGFDMRFCSSGLWGIGTYFAVNASYSNNYAHKLSNGVKQFFLTDVCVGEPIKLAQDGTLRLPPLKKNRPKSWDAICQ